MNSPPTRFRRHVRRSAAQVWDEYHRCLMRHQRLTAAGAEFVPEGISPNDTLEDKIRWCQRRLRLRKGYRFLPPALWLAILQLAIELWRYWAANNITEPGPLPVEGEPVERT